MEGTIVSIRGQQAEIDVRGKRLRAPLKDLRVLGQSNAQFGTVADAARCASTSTCSRAKGC